MNVNVYMNHCDPQWKISPKEILYKINYHALLFDKPLIQDNFLISRSFQNVAETSKGMLYELFKNGIISIAIRDNIGDSLIELKNILRNKIKNKEYESFEGLGENRLYYEVTFESYLREIEKSIKHYNKRLIRWSETRLGTNFRELMRRSSLDGTSGLEPKLATKIFHDIDALAKTGKGANVTHSRTMYFDYANKLSDKQIANQINNWASHNYLKNMPDTYNLSNSFTPYALKSIKAWDPHEVLHNNLSEFVYREVEKMNPLLFLENVLADIEPDSISTIRQFEEFQELQKALKEHKKDKIIDKIFCYLARLDEEAPKHYPPKKKEIKKYSCHHKLKIKIAIIGSLIAILPVETFDLMGCIAFMFFEVLFEVC